MERLRNYDIAFSGLKDGKHEFQFEIGSEFLHLYETEQEFSKPNITAEVLMDKHSTFLEFFINISGTVELVCDISNEDFSHPIENEIKVLVKFGSEYDDSDVDVITISDNAHSFNVAQLIYEDIVLSIPMKKVSPNLSEEDLQILEKFSPKDEDFLNIEEEKDEDIEVDPRWEALKKLKDKN
ncbi:YceD family protein [Frigoriflavimonas asaccharolytica]|uniref:Uncharacterized metal-binding protein YceD (DUF177 family) n=1 Tax=Frigoriflavimonas asaccharolytica TaxID=2735899 RepID=A0A8J8GCH1_9FLAO|nr:DUF177 domain-containing protein [Frigoriflavimonas asaccharolytica]NRS93415.1 uncharacterized metal-binding protein YceD (DUF177 family) [Frigoriflavimonas asaccharolytica]